MSASYPAAVKSFTTKVDQVDTVFSADVDDLQNEIVAIESVLGPNPQGSATTVGQRLDALGTDTVTVTGNQTITGNKTFSGIGQFDNLVRVTSPAAINGITSATHPFQIGPNTAYNIAVGPNAVQARNNNAAVDMNLQPYGGRVNIGGSRVLTTADMGTGHGLDADTLDGVQGSGFSPSGHKHPANFCQLSRSTVLNVPDSTWTTVIFDTQEALYQDSGGTLFNMGAGQFFTPPAVGPALWYMGFRATFDKNNSGLRGIRFLNHTGGVVDQGMEEGNWTARDFIQLSGMYYYQGTSSYWLCVQLWQDSGRTLQVLANTNSHRFSMTWAAVSRGLA